MFKKIAIAGLLILLLIPALWLGFPYYTAKRIEVTVTDKERVIREDQASYYLVFTENEVFQNVDAWRRFKVNSSDVQGALRVRGISSGGSMRLPGAGAALYFEGARFPPGAPVGFSGLPAPGRNRLFPEGGVFSLPS